LSREIQILEAMGLGPVWQARPGFFAEQAGVTDEDESKVNVEEMQEAAEYPPDQTTIATPAPSESLAPSAETSAPAMATSLEDLKREVAHCEHCDLCKTRTHPVFGRGNQNARWLLIGEAPGEQEDKQGLPFVGRAGHLLDNMLAAAHLSCEQDVYIANVLKCRPPSNRNPAPNEISACRAYLQQQIQLIQPEIIVALGRFAAQTLLDSSLSISRLRGVVHEYQGIPLIVSYHPAYLLRNPPDKARAWEDWQLAHRTLGT